MYKLNRLKYKWNFCITSIIVHTETLIEIMCTFLRKFFKLHKYFLQILYVGDLPNRMCKSYKLVLFLTWSAHFFSNYSLMRFQTELMFYLNPEMNRTKNCWFTDLATFSWRPTELTCFSYIFLGMSQAQAIGWLETCLHRLTIFDV